MGDGRVSAEVVIISGTAAEPVIVDAYDSWLEVGRFFGAFTVGANAFDTPFDVAETAASIDAWDGVSTTGCADTLGVYGGPVTAPAPLVVVPSVGPRD